jgi:hypothetical protein
LDPRLAVAGGFRKLHQEIQTLYTFYQKYLNDKEQKGKMHSTSNQAREFKNSLLILVH